MIVRTVGCGRIFSSFFGQRSFSSCKLHTYVRCLASTVPASGDFQSRFPNAPFLSRLPRKRGKVRCSSTEANDERRLVYEGPLSRSVKLVKVFSLSTALATIVATPVLMLYGKESVPVAGKLAIGVTILLAGTTTTFLLHWMTKVYVHRMFYNASTGNFTVETMSLLARRKETEFSVDEMKLAKEPTAFTTFQAKGKKYFLHSDLLEAQQVLQFVRENRA